MFVPLFCFKKFSFYWPAPAEACIQGGPQVPVLDQERNSWDRNLKDRASPFDICRPRTEPGIEEAGM